MEYRSIILHPDTEQEIRQIVPFIRSNGDLDWVADWLMTFGIATIKFTLEKHPQMTLADIMKLTTINADDAFKSYSH